MKRKINISFPLTCWLDIHGIIKNISFDRVYTPHFETRNGYRSSLLIAFELPCLRNSPKLYVPRYATISLVPDSEGHEPNNYENNICGFCPPPPPLCHYLSRPCQTPKVIIPSVMRTTAVVHVTQQPRGAKLFIPHDCSSGPQYELICIQPIRDRAYSFAYSQSTAGDSTLGIN